MAYRLKHHTDLHWFDLDKLEHPDLASAIIQRLQGPSYQGQSPDELIKGFSKVFPLGFDEHALNALLQTGDYFLIAEGDAQQPLLRDGNKISFYIDKESKSQQHTEQEWQFTSTSYAEHLSASLRFAIMQTPKPIFSVAARQNAKTATNTNQTKQDDKTSETYWVELVCRYDNGDHAIAEGLPYKVIFSDGSIKTGKLANKPTYIKDIPKGEVKVEFGYPDIDKELEQARRELKADLNEIVAAAKERGDMLDEVLSQENIAMQGLIVTGAFFDGMAEPLTDIGDFFESVVEEARVWMNQWDDKVENLEEYKEATLEKVNAEKEVLLSHIGEIDRIREKAWEAFKKNDMDAFHKHLEELARYADESKDNVQAYGRKTVKELEESYNAVKILCTDKQVHKMLKQFSEDYTDALSITQSARSTGVLVGNIGMCVVLSLVAGVAGAAVAIGIAVASKAKLINKVYEKIKAIIELLKKKKSTPENQPVGSHNSKLDATSEKVEEKPVKEEEKENCEYKFPGGITSCTKRYNKNCPLCHKEAKQYGTRLGSKPNSGNSGTLSDRIMANLQEKGLARSSNRVVNAKGEVLYEADTDKNKNHKSYHPWFQGDSTLAAHHIICSSAVKEKRWIDYFNMCAYNINCKENGVMLPSRPDIACQLGVALHYKNHNEGKATTLGPSISYTDGVIELLAELEEKISENEYCDNPEKVNISINKKSKLILKYINNFSWTLTGDGADYRANDGTVVNLGCAGNLKVNKLTPKTNACITRNHDYIFPNNFNKPLEVGK